MSHTSRCESAVGFACQCTCGGARHGGVLIVGIRSTSDEAYQATKDWSQPRRWQEISSDARQTSIKSSSSERRPAITGVVTELVSTLIDQVRENGEIDAVELLAQGISDDIADEFESRLSTAGPASRKSQHLWCVVMATICRVYDEAAEFAVTSIDDLVDHTMRLLRAPASASRVEKAEVTDVYSHRSRVARAFDFEEYDWLGALVKKALKAVIAAIKSLGEELAMKYVRLIAAVICPDPDRHPTVVKHCIWPLLNGPFREALQSTLADEMRRWTRNAYIVIPTDPGTQNP